jgi:serine/threonine-protein kinase
VQPGYELIKKVAGGGMGEVFVARRTGMGNFEKRVALKLLLPHLVSSPELVKRFHEEARLAARMHHPNIVEIFDVGEAEGRPFIAMQLVDGVTLGKLVREVGRRGERLPLAMVRHLATGLCEALQYAHTLVDSKGQALHVVHRDVTPGNILVSRNGAVLLADFGIARIRDGSMTQPGVFRGKAAYVAPEQVLAHARVDARADIYSAALTLYEALTGEHPFKREQAKDALQAVVEGKMSPVESLREDVTPGMAAALKKALAFKPTDRFSSAREFREAFVDGPSATAPELVEFVARFAPPSEEEVDDAVVEGTKSILTVTPTQLELPAALIAPPPPPKRRGAWVLLGVLVVGLGSAFALSGLSEPVEDRPQAKPLTGLSEPVEDRPQEKPLTGLSEPVEDRPQEKAPRPRPRPTPKKLTKPAVASAAALRVGYLTADATPWAEVSLDGKPLDRTPFSRFPIPAGRHTLVFKGPNGEKRQRPITVTEGEVTAVRVEF